MAGSDQFNFFRTPLPYFPFSKYNAFYNISLEILNGKNAILKHCICRRVSFLWNGDGTWIQENIAVHLLGLQYMGMSVDQDVSLA